MRLTVHLMLDLTEVQRLCDTSFPCLKTPDRHVLLLSTGFARFMRLRDITFEG
jgi:hypothetical protein